MRDLLQEMRAAKDALDWWRVYLVKHIGPNGKVDNLKAALEIRRAYDNLLDTLGKHVAKEFPDA